MNIIDLIFPKKCLECGKSGVYLCIDCVKRAPLVKQVCIECEKPAIDGMTHVKCLKKRSLERCVSLWVYQGVVRKAILKLKYSFAYEIADELADYYLRFLKKNDLALPGKAALIPVPLHKKRKNWRGFNQTDQIGKIVADKMKWEFLPDFLIRKKHKVPQTELKEKVRLENVRGIFTINPKYQKPLLLTTSYQLLIFDDVLTTGATLKEAGKVLKRNFANQVWGLTIAR